MSIEFTQEHRLGKIFTALGEDTLFMLRFSGNEHVNDLFAFSVEVIAEEEGLDFNTLMGTNVTVSLASMHHGERMFNGIVTKMSWAGTVEEGGERYSLELRPWFWLTGKRRNQRIFHNLNVTEIVETVCEPYTGLGKPALKNNCKTNYPKIEYVVQYGESDLDFIRRMLERYSINFYFTHERDSHTLVLNDSGADLPSIAGNHRPFVPRDSTHIADEERIWSWQPESNLTTGAIKLTDFNFKTPDGAMVAEQPSDAGYANGQIESFDFPGGYLKGIGGKLVAKARINQERVADKRILAEGDTVSLGAGMLMGLGGQAPKGTIGRYICMSAIHDYTSDAYVSGGGGGDDHAYSGRYELIPFSVPLVPQITTARSRIHGPQTAMVVGEGEIDVDRYGRILVMFPWSLDQEKSMRCRVSQSWASKGWGGIVIPRIGMEVIVEFLNGDPDHPIVTGCVYNGKNMPPYDLPKHKTRSSFMSHTHQGSGFNELRIEDEQDKEEIFIHAQKDMTEKIENHHTQRVNVNKVESIGHNKASEIGNNLKEAVVGDYELKIGPGGEGSITPSGAKDNTQGMPLIGKAFGAAGSNPGDGNFNVSIEGNHNKVVKQNIRTKVAGNYMTKVDGDYVLDVEGDITIKAGNKITIKTGTSVMVLSNSGRVTLDGNSLTMNLKSLITMIASLVKVN